MAKLRTAARRAASRLMVPSILVAAIAQPSLAQEPIGDLSDDAYAALDEVTEQSVTATVSFLASDELQGRKTATASFDVAAAYVASRLQAAGAVGLGEDGSYFVINSVPTWRDPTDATLATGGATLKATAMRATDETIEFSGSIPSIDDATDEQTVVFSNLYDQDTSDSKNAKAAVLEISNKAREKDIDAVLVLVNPQSALWQNATQRQQSRRLRATKDKSPAIMLVAAKKLRADALYKVRIPKVEIEYYPMRNVAAIIRGRDEEAAKKAILFSAHLDHLGVKPDAAAGEDAIFNGADDDATGVTAVLTLADVFGKLENKPLHSTIFMTFWGEEMGLLGSTAFGEAPAWPLEDMIANVNIEMIGRPADGANNKMWMTGWNKSDLGTLFAQGARRVGVEVFEHPQFSAVLYTRSDNYALAKQGVVAHSFSAGSLHKDYHKVTDEWTKLDLPHMTQIIRGIFAGAMPIAEGKLTPKSK
ncbi:MAG: M20/M25/M40 family metallo-hydrolase [Aureliella sp.]